MKKRNVFYVFLVVVLLSIGASRVENNQMFPVGSVYINALSDENPGYSLGYGKWLAFGEGRVLVGAGSGSGLTPRLLGDMGGSEVHTLEVSEMPQHNHSSILRVTDQSADEHNPVGAALADTFDLDIYSDSEACEDGLEGTVAIGNTGGSNPHNNMPPFVVVYIWLRIE